MPPVEDKLNKMLERPFECRVYYFASTEAELLREAAKEVNAALRADGADEATRVDGPAPDMGEVIAAAGTLSFLGGVRSVELREISPSSMVDKDAAELAALFADLENAVMVVTCLYKDAKAGKTAKAKALFAAAQKTGFAAELQKPTRRQMLDYIKGLAQKQGASFAGGGAETLLERAGDNRALLANEADKLAAVAGYGEITVRMVEAYSVHNVEADVFQLVGLIGAGRKNAAQAKLGRLLALRHEPVAIAAVLNTSFVDMYITRTGLEAKHSLGEIAAAFGYAKEYRLQKARENAARYTTQNLKQAVMCLAGLDRRLKSVTPRLESAFLHAAVGQLILLGER